MTSAFTIRPLALGALVGLALIGLPTHGEAGVLFAESPQYTVTVIQPPAALPISFHAQQTTRFAPDGAFVMEVGPGQSQTSTLRTVALFQAKPGFILTGVTLSGAAVAEAWEGSYSVGGSWTVGTPSNPATASGSFPTASNVTWNQNASIEFPGAVVNATAGSIQVDAQLALGIGGASAAFCGRPICARIGAPSIRVDVSWASAPPPVVPAFAPGGLFLLGVAGIAVGSRAARQT